MSTVTLPSGLKLSYSEQGNADDRAVVLLPGPTDSWHSYQPVLDLLPHEIRAVAISQRGHGDSDKPATGYGVEDFAADVVPLLDAVGIEQAVLTGHSGSCLVARRVALDHPDRVSGLILEASPTTLRNDVQLLAFVDSVVSNLNDPISPNFARSFIAETSSPNVAPDVADLLVDELMKVPSHVWRQTFAGLLEHDDSAELAGIEAPTLLIWGDADTLVARQMQDQLIRSIRDSKLLVYKNVGHTPRWEDPGRFRSDLVAFIHRVAAAGTSLDLPSKQGF